MKPSELKKSVEALLFVHNRPIQVGDFVKVIADGASKSDVLAALEQLSRELILADKPYSLEKISEGWQLLTRPNYDNLVTKLVEVTKRESLTRAQLETLAVIAYSQPVTRSEIEGIRGVGCSPVMKVLQEKSLVKMVGKANRLGSPALYGTTPHFLEVFGLDQLSELPEKEDIMKTFSEKKEPEQDSQDEK